MKSNDKIMSQAIANVDEVKAKLKAMPKTSNSGISNTAILTITKDFANSTNKPLNNQCTLLLAYLRILGGTATVGQLDEMINLSKDTNVAFVHNKGKLAGQSYGQDMSVVISHYKDKMLGNEAWTQTRGTYAIVTVS